MDDLSPSSDPNAYGSGYAQPTRRSLSDGVILASAKPKKRAGRTKFKETRHPIYRGVRMRNANKWVCEVREPNKKTRIWLGTYPTAEMAARAHDVAALALRGNQACLNFADSVWRLPVPVSNDAEDIRKAAAEAAEAFRPKDMEVEVGDNMVDGEEMVTTSVDVEEASHYVDEESVYYMPRLISDMAEGMLLSPPRCLVGWSPDDVESPHDDMSLWNFSI
ncbi:putative transcription factor AP2-EREBP family [Helianthus annuus]|uniref:dehydration-responsive element-binding protein 1B isoform X1 n=1 Tax=Helianthus annuus TaxID=4232 RepID=UPI000B8F84B0|nr:dehydration-responsive element-binding protein 1B isoform X1 [Helianthus annuus]KAJ0549253.1 putative transcription factor AP2-EREBP family [Helianthus annuus]KAJ0562207.1 putative transcription factor AP2-EREBP family [Helianthus annuus]KAJ0727581.1 putative transcription factor AP2-EREBP family [Helianthus annuus]